MTCWQSLLSRGAYGTIDIGSKESWSFSWKDECDINPQERTIKSVLGDTMNIITIERDCFYFYLLCMEICSIGTNL